MTPRERRIKFLEWRISSDETELRELQAYREPEPARESQQATEIVQPVCSICRRRHGKETRHECE